MSLRSRFVIYFTSIGIFFACVGAVCYKWYDYRESDYLHNEEAMVVEFRILSDLKFKIQNLSLSLLSDYETTQEPFFEKWCEQFYSDLDLYLSLSGKEESLGMEILFHSELESLRSAYLQREMVTMKTISSKWLSKIETVMTGELEEMAEQQMQIATLVDERKWVLLLSAVGLLFLIVMIGYFLADRLTQVLFSLTTSMQAYRMGKPSTIPKLHPNMSTEEKALLQAFEDLTLKLDLSEKRRLELYRFIVHDFNGAMMAHWSTLDLLLSKIQTKRHESIDDETAAIHSSRQHLEILLQDLLDQQRDSILPTDLCPLPLLDVVEAWSDRFLPLIKQHGIELHIEVAETLVVLGDEVLIGRILQNLLINSLRYFSRSGCIQITANRNESLIELFFKDNGRGIPEDIRHEIFATGIGDRQSEVQQGLGLAFCLQAMKCMDGSIQLCENESTSTAGACFKMLFKAIDP